MARRTAVFRLAALLSSLLLMSGYVAWQAGAFHGKPIAAPDVDGQPEFFPSTKRAAIFEPEAGQPPAGVLVPSASPTPQDFPLYSSKSGVPLLPVEGAGLTSPVSLPSAEFKPTYLDSSKYRAPLITVPKSDAASQNEPTAQEPAMLPGSKSFAPLITVPSKSPPPATVPKGKGGNP